MFDRDHNPSHLTLYPDILKINKIIVVKQKFAKMPFVYYLQIHFGYSAAAGWPDYRFVKFVINKKVAFLKFLTIMFFFFIFKTSGYNAECDGL